MLGSAGRSEFFAREASDYLRALEPLLGEAPPDGDSFVRLARALRGAAMLAGPASFTRAASQLEQISRRATDPSFDWAGAVPRLREAHAVFTRLTERATSWDASLDAEADELDKLLGKIVTAPLPTPAASARATTTSATSRSTCVSPSGVMGMTSDRACEKTRRSKGFAGCIAISRSGVGSWSGLASTEPSVASAITASPRSRYLSPSHPPPSHPLAARSSPRAA